MDGINPADRVRQIVREANALADPAAQAEFVRQACGGDVLLLAEVEALLHTLRIGTADLPAEDPDAQSRPLAGLEGERVGRYRLLQQLGEGGFGVVYLAEQEEPVRRRVALKVLKPGMDTRQVIARFEAERQALALMDHPNIAKVLDAGATDTGRPFFVMELVKGVRLTEYCDLHRLSTKERLEIFGTVCQAIQHAHQKGVIHRDIKPSNILVTVLDDVAIPKIIDFGIAKAIEGRLTDKTLFTRLDQFLGTPAYMSPEQAEMSALDIDTRSDIYSLGVLLYELLTGRLPFDPEELQKAGLNEMRRIIRENEPRLPSTRLTSLSDPELTEVAKRRRMEAPKLIHTVRGDMDWIVMKALEKDRTRRYPTANALAMDVQRHLNNEPIVARASTAVERLMKWTRRRPAAAAMAGVVLMASLACLTLAGYALREAAEKRRLAEERRVALNRAETERQKALQSNALLEQSLRQSDLQSSSAYLREGDPGRAVAMLGRVLRNDPSNRVAAARLLDALRGHEFPLPISSLKTDSTIYRMALSPDGQRLAIAHLDHTMRVWRLRDGEPLSPLMSHSNEVSGLQFTPDLDGLIALIGAPGTNSYAQVWSTVEGRRISEIHPHGGLRGKLTDRFQGLVRYQRDTASEFDTVLATPDGRSLILSTHDHRLEAWDIRSGNRIPEFQPQPDTVPLSLTPDGKLLLAGIASERLEPHFQVSLKVLDATTGQTKFLIKARKEWYSTEGDFSAWFSADGRLLYYAEASEGGGRVVSTATGLPLTCRFEYPITPYWASVVPSWDGLTVERYGRTPVAGFEQQNPNLTIRTYRNFVGEPRASVALLDQKAMRLILRTAEDQVTTYDLRAGQAILEPSSLTRNVSMDLEPRLNHQGTAVAFANSDQRVRIVDACSRQLVKAPFVHPSKIVVLEFSRDDRFLATATDTGLVRVWEASSGNAVFSRTNHNEIVTCLRLSPDNKRLAVLAEGGILRAWSIPDGVVLSETTVNPTTQGMFWGPESDAVITYGADQELSILHVGSSEPPVRRMKHRNRILSAELSPNGTRVLTTSADRSAQIWDYRTGLPTTVSLEHAAPVLFGTFSADGSRVITVAEDRTARVWDAGSGRPITRSLTHDRNIDRAVFLEGGQWIATYGPGATVWDAGSGQALTGDLVALWTPQIPSGTYVQMAASGCCVVARTRHEIVPLALAPVPVPNWLNELADAMAGQRVDSGGGILPLSFDEFQRIKGRLESVAGVDDYSCWARWLFEDRAVRGINPYSKLKVGDLLASEESDEYGASPLADNVGSWAMFARGALREAMRETRDPSSTIFGSAWIKTVKLTEKALTLSSADAAVWVTRAGFWKEVGSLEECTYSLEQAERIKATAEAALLRSELAAFEGRSNQALADLGRAIELAQSNDLSATNALRKALISRANLLTRLGQTAAAEKDVRTLRALAYPIRDPRAEKQLIDLTSFYNAGLVGKWHWGDEGSDLSELPRGLAEIDGTRFDIRGLVQLFRATTPVEPYPDKVTGIQVDQPCRKLHFLQAAIYAGDTKEGARIGWYKIHRANGDTVDVPLEIGRNIADWWRFPKRDGTPLLRAAWVGENRASRDQKVKIGLFHATWTNDAPGIEVSSVDFVYDASGLEPADGAAPFLVALTVESP